jgi:cyclopropane-fatty-acyl-phospholipid synthase
MTRESSNSRFASPRDGASREVDSWWTGLLESGLVPDWVVRAGIRRICAARLRAEDEGDPASQLARLMRHVAALKASPIAISTDAANQQHYEVPAPFFERVLGPRLKYSSGYWPPGVATLAESEEAMLALTVERARLADGQHVLELGCGWGSLTLFMAERFPASRITAVSNSHGQRAFIEARARARGLTNVAVITSDVNTLELPSGFDRVVSVEMFEHARNYERLFERISGWLDLGALLFVHIFVHTRFAYPYEVRDASDWMAQHFFTGGQMPSDDLFLYFQRHLSIVDHWTVDGTHYEKTCNAWLERMDRERDALAHVFEQTYGVDQVRRWWVRWRVFFMACAELFGYRSGREWMVSHYLFEKHS